MRLRVKSVTSLVCFLLCVAVVGFDIHQIVAVHNKAAAAALAIAAFFAVFNLFRGVEVIRAS